MTAAMNENVLFLSVRELSAKIRSRTLSPVALAEASLARLDTAGRKLNAVVTLMREPALAHARQAEAEIKAGRWRGPLHGIPYGVKDLLATKGAPTTWGAEPYRDQEFNYDATVVMRLRAAGAVLVAKLAMIELAGGLGFNDADASFTGPCMTPWNTRFWSGGSSSGPGAAVAAGCVPFAIASENSGSIVTPAAFCGVTGLRPTYGLVSRHGAMALSWTLDKIGPMARSADDCALVLAAIAGPDPADESCVGRRFKWTLPRGERPGRLLRIGVPKGSIEDVQPEVRENFEKALATFGSAAVVARNVEWPDFPWGAAVSAIISAEGATAFLDFIEQGRALELRNPVARTGGYSGMVLPAVDYLQAMRLRRPMRRALAALFDRFDVIATPTRASVSYPIDRNFEAIYPEISVGVEVVPAGNLAGLPAIALPNGFGENGLPTSISFMGPAFSEALLATVGHRFQRATDWHLQHPPQP